LHTLVAVGAQLLKHAEQEEAKSQQYLGDKQLVLSADPVERYGTEWCKYHLAHRVRREEHAHLLASNLVAFELEGEDWRDDCVANRDNQLGETCTLHF